MIHTPYGELVARDCPRKLHKVFKKINLNTMRASIIDPDSGKVELDFRATSYVENFLTYVRRTMSASYYGNSVSVKQMSDGSNLFVTSKASNLLVGGSRDLDGRGILVGSGSTAPSIENWSLNTRIDADISYNNVEFLTPVIDSDNRYIEFFRPLTNHKSLSLDINEIGLVSYSTPFLIAHDILPEPMAIPSGGGKVLRYKMDFPKMFPNFVKFFYRGFTGTNYTMIDTGGFNRSSSMGYLMTGSFSSLAGVTTRGIRISSTEIPTAWNANTIADMYGTDTFTHSVSTFDPIVLDLVNNKAHFDVYRDFTNISGVDQTVREYGIIFWGGSYENYYFLGHAGTLTVPEVVPNSEVFRVIYRFSIET